MIEHNTFIEDNGVWVASRMGENTLPMECSDPQYLPGYALDHTDDNVVRDDHFQNVTFDVRVEDDDAVVTDNDFVSADPIDEAIVVGTRYRTEALSQPVDGTTISGNTANIAGSPNPYRWIWGHTNTTFSDNRSLGRVVGLCEGAQPPGGPFVMTVAVAVLTDPANPPDEIRELPPPGLLPPCATASNAGSALSNANLTLRRLDTPPGDDRLRFKGELVIPRPFVPALDPVANGVAVVMPPARAHSTRRSRAAAYDPATQVGWKAAHSGTSWKYVDKSALPPGGITTLTVKDLAKKQPGLVRVTVGGKRSAYAVDTASLPLTGFLILDPPTAATGLTAQKIGLPPFLAVVAEDVDIDVGSDGRSHGKPTPRSLARSNCHGHLLVSKRLRLLLPFRRVFVRLRIGDHFAVDVPIV